MKLTLERLLTAFISTATIALFSTTAVAAEVNPNRDGEFDYTAATTSQQLAEVQGRE
ncbi:MAG: hypothetical protein AB4426_26940 [Xenococcaceae cyanobacterium]